MMGVLRRRGRYWKWPQYPQEPSKQEKVFQANENVNSDKIQAKTHVRELETNDF